MSELTAEQHHVLKDYNEVLDTVSDTLEFLETNLKEEVSDEVQQVFEDLLLAFEQLSVSHEQMIIWFEDKVEMSTLVADYHEVIDLLKEWFVFESNEEKRELLFEKVTPAFESWKDRMQLFVKPYIAH
ncbi:hypothetical protein [Halobacillus mangrovi]|uniref:DUF8042 domain-containing protein n=1 Tax=Halobacillus mangrovi TaxID=402384 RepID=A0A1W5ZT93_9BACI|nr:hypothetical protein [Halobacillus mangrovi]ARI76524.1 hypothetical protein HM131_06610 [Halobacillus mangrovi]